VPFLSQRDPRPVTVKTSTDAELDATVAHLHGLSAADLRHIIEAFHEGWDYEERLRATLRHVQHVESIPR
jgi:hypothetical protein